MYIYLFTILFWFFHLYLYFPLLTEHKKCQIVQVQVLCASSVFCNTSPFFQETVVIFTNLNYKHSTLIRIYIFSSLNFIHWSANLKIWLYFFPLKNPLLTHHCLQDEAQALGIPNSDLPFSAASSPSLLLPASLFFLHLQLTSSL